MRKRLRCTKTRPWPTPSHAIITAISSRITFRRDIAGLTGAFPPALVILITVTHITAIMGIIVTGMDITRTTATATKGIMGITDTTRITGGIGMVVITMVAMLMAAIVTARTADIETAVTDRADTHTAVVIGTPARLEAMAVEATSRVAHASAAVRGLK